MGKYRIEIAITFEVEADNKKKAESEVRKHSNCMSSVGFGTSGYYRLERKGKQRIITSKVIK